MTKLAPEWVRTSDPVIRSPARYRWTTAPAMYVDQRRSVGHFEKSFYLFIQLSHFAWGICLPEVEHKISQ